MRYNRSYAKMLRICRPLWQKSKMTYNKINALTLVIPGIVIILFVIGCSCAFSAEIPGIPGKQAVLAIIGEAEGEGFKAQLAHSCALRNRGTLQGVYGLNAPRVKRGLYSKAIFEQVSRAWTQSADADICRQLVGNASFWGSTIVDKAWIKRMQRAGYVHTATIGSTAFYRKGK